MVFLCKLAELLINISSMAYFNNNNQQLACKNIQNYSKVAYPQPEIQAQTKKKSLYCLGIYTKYASHTQGV